MQMRIKAWKRWCAKLVIYNRARPLLFFWKGNIWDTYDSEYAFTNFPVRCNSGPECPPGCSGSPWAAVPFGTPGILRFSYQEKKIHFLDFHNQTQT